VDMGANLVPTLEKSVFDHDLRVMSLKQNRVS